MKKYGMRNLIIAISLIITVGFFATVLTDTLFFQKQSKTSTENMVTLTSQNISNEIDAFLSKPYTVAKTMSDDALLKNWLENENILNPDSEALMKKYLSDYKRKYDYDEVFLVSENTHLYYYNGGIDRTVSASNPDDKWYFDLKNSRISYNMNIISDSVHNGKLYLFIDFKIKDEHGRLLGIAGIGLDMSRINVVFSRYEKAYDLNAFVASNSGNINVYCNGSEFFKQLSEIPEITSNRDLMNKNKIVSFVWNKAKGVNTCITTEYISDLDWYICVKKDMASTERVFLKRLSYDIIYVCFILAFIIAVIASVFSRYNRFVIKIENTDELTNLPNRKQFYRLLEKLSKTKMHGSWFFIFDIDHFKLINDSRGHLFGNKVLSSTAIIAKKHIGECGIISRWGGDEFAGIIYPNSDLNKIFKNIMSELAEYANANDTNVTISVGIYKIQKNDSIDTMLNRSDKALYRSKNNGRDQLTYYTPDMESEGEDLD